MPVFLNTLGQPTLGIGICDRCKRKSPLAELVPDPNSPGLRVHEDGCVDEYDPWRLPPRQADNTTLPFYRPDEGVGVPGVSPPATPFQINGNWFWDIESSLQFRFITLSSAFLPEKTFGALVGLVTVVDPERPSSAFTILVSDLRFEVVSSVLKLKDNQEVFFVTEQTIIITLTAVDGVITFPQTFTLHVVQGAVAPTDIVLLNSTVLEQTFGAPVGNITVADPQLPNTTEVVTVTNDARFTVAMFDKFEGLLQLLPGQQVIFASEPTISLTLRATNGFGLFFDKNFVITTLQLPPPPQPPTSLDLSNLTIVDHTDAAVVGTLTATDPNLPPGSSTQNMTVQNDARFQVTVIDGFHGTLALKPGNQVDHLVEPTITLTVRTTNTFALFLEHTFVITVTPLVPPTAPTDITLSNSTVASLSPGATVGVATVTDAMLPGTTETITVQNDARFQVTAIDNGSGTLALKPGQQVDAATEPTVTLLLRATNSDSLFFEKSFVITVVGAPPPTGRAFSDGFSQGFS